MSIPEKLPSNHSGLAGEYFVEAESYRRGYSVGLTMGTAKSIDILAEMNDKTFQIPVKTIRRSKNIGWPIND